MKLILTGIFLLSGFGLFPQSNRGVFFPSGRSQHAATFDAKAERMLIFGGSKHYKNPNQEAALFDGRLWAWSRSGWSVLTEGGPAPREDAKMVYHESNQKSYLFGGRVYDASGKPEVLNEFWEWNGTSWKLLSESNPQGKLLHANMVYDPDRNRIVLFGGVSSEKGFSNDVWEWDGSAWLKIDSNNAPSPRIAHSMTYSYALQKTLIVGGVNQNAENLKDVWSWDGKNFELLNNSIPSLELGSGNAVCLDKKNGLNLMLVGRPTSLSEIKETSLGKNQCETWMWDGKSWKKQTSKSGPSLREGQSLVFDKRNNRVLLFGGSAREESRYDNPNDVWMFRDDRWTLLAHE